MSSVGAALRAAAERIGGDSARAEAELLLAAVSGRSRAWLYAHGDDALEPPTRDAFLALVARRCAGEPVAHLLGRREFWSLTLEVTADTLIPRPETELLVEQALARLPDDAADTVLDLGTGSGAIALAIASERPRAAVTAVDASAGALAVARRNAAHLGLDRLRFLRSDWFSALGGERFGMIVANPPYIAEGDPHLREGDLRFEPRSALASGSDGLDDIRRIVAAAPDHLVPKGWLLIEHGIEQGEAVRALLVRAGFSSAATVRDLEDRDRVTLGRR